ncbi:MAG: hypothetical protein RLZZ127_3175 [Planctomycetota bacterium]|jgi:hypothetical protein
MSEPAAMMADIGTPHRLPLAVAVRVAWTSIRVRLARSLVTVSSVVLAVAFLLTVAGEAVATRAVHAGWWSETAAQRQARLVRDVLERPRDEHALLALLAGDGGFRTWAAGIGAQVPACPPEAAADALALVGWIRGLKPTQAYLLVRTDEPLPWVLALDAPGRVEALVATAQRFKGQLLPIDRPRIDALAAAAPMLRAALAGARRAEELRLAQVAAAGGAAAVAGAMADGGIDLDPTAAGLPLAQVLPAADRRALAAQLRLDRIRAAAAAAFTAARPAKGTTLHDALEPDATGAAAEQVRAAIAAAGGKPDEVADELDRRARQEATATTLAAVGFDPDGGALRTIALVGLSLLVCVVGIVNTMMMAVTERFREIATMKCLGAPDGFILRTFLVESVFLGLVGSLVGLVLGVLLVLLQSGLRFGGAFWSAFPAADLGLTALAAVGTGLVLAVVGALIPALTAARMHPIEAMRVEQ